MNPSAPLQPPSDTGQAPGGMPASSNPTVPDASGQVQGWIADAVQSVRRIGMKYPETLPEVRDIMQAITRMQPKILSAQPAPQPPTPPV